MRREEEKLPTRQTDEWGNRERESRQSDRNVKVNEERQVYGNR